MAQVEFSMQVLFQKEKERAPPILDNTNRFQRSNEIICLHPRLILYKSYDRQTGLEVTWHELLLNDIHSDKLTLIIQKADRIKQIHNQSINSIIHHWFSKSKDMLFYITKSLSTSTIYSNILNSYLEIKPQVIARWFFPVLQSLQYLHSLTPPIIHGKIHPENIYMKASSGLVKICSPSLKPNIQITKEHKIKVYPTMPPEFLMNIEETYSDIYSFGMSILFTVTRIEPYDECKSPAELLYKITSNIPPNSLSLVTDKNLRELIEKCLKPPLQRPTAPELLSDKFFKQRFINSNLVSQSSSSEELVVIFTGKSRSDTDLSTVNDDLIQLDSIRSSSTARLTESTEFS